MRRVVVMSAAIVVAWSTACSGSTDAPIVPPRPAASASASPVHFSPAARATHTAVTNRPPFRWSAHRVTASDLGKSWHSGCPVGPHRLRELTLTFWGFDHAAHRGHLVVRHRVVPDVVAAFRAMYKGKFNIRRMQPVSVYGGDDNVSMRHDNTSAFNCRYAVSDGPKSWSMHAYGEAIDINTVENPYYLNGRVRPKKGKPYMDRSNVRPGMIVSGSVPLQKFTSLGWGWGGNWSSSPDYQHFSTTGG
jgi:hypothetical protein